MMSTVKISSALSSARCDSALTCSGSPAARIASQAVRYSTDVDSDGANTWLSFTRNGTYHGLPAIIIRPSSRMAFSAPDMRTRRSARASACSESDEG